MTIVRQSFLPRSQSVYVCVCVFVCPTSYFSRHITFRFVNVTNVYAHTRTRVIAPAHCVNARHSARSAVNTSKKNPSNPPRQSLRGCEYKRPIRNHRRPSCTELEINQHFDNSQLYMGGFWGLAKVVRGLFWIVSFGSFRIAYPRYKKYVLNYWWS